MPDYQNGKIYTIRCKTDETLVYVGSTTQPLYKRLDKHKQNSKSSPIRSSIGRLINQLGTDVFYIELYENYKCNSKEELNKREGEVIREIGTVNKVVAGRTRQEYREENVEKIRETRKAYREENVEKIKEYSKTYYSENVEKIRETRKAYREENVEKIRETMKAYREKNAEKIREMKKEKYECVCGSVCRRADTQRHFRSKKHIDFIERNIEK
jgi:hypothetical protein